MTAPSAPVSAKSSQVIRGIIDYGGIAVFLGVYFLGGKDMIKANWALAGVSALAVLTGLVLERRLAPMPIVTGLFAVLFATLATRFHDPRFVKMQPTAINLFLGAVMLGGAAMKRNPLRALLGSAIHLDPPAWRTLMIRYGCLFVTEACVNEAMWRTQSDAIWVVWHRPVLLALSIGFSVAQVPFLMKHAAMGDDAQETAPAPSED